ncbi:MAG: hypothetical protein R2911_40180 [Caldilineaceae bacterium]
MMRSSATPDGGLRRLIISTLDMTLIHVLEKEHEWGIAPVRPRVLLARLESFIATSREFDYLPGLRDWAARLLAVLQARWPELEPLPLYPAFRAQS